MSMIMRDSPQTQKPETAKSRFKCPAAQHDMNCERSRAARHTPPAEAGSIIVDPPRCAVASGYAEIACGHRIAKREFCDCATSPKGGEADLQRTPGRPGVRPFKTFRMQCRGFDFGRVRGPPSVAFRLRRCLIGPAHAPHAAGAEPRREAGRVQFIGAPATETGGSARRAAPQSVASMAAE